LWYKNKTLGADPSNTLQTQGIHLSNADYESVRLQDILKEEAVEVHFQPIVSIQEKKVVGFEGLSRGVEMPSGRLIPPMILIQKAVEEDLALELDALFRKKVFQYFSEQFRNDPRIFLTVNMETNVGGETTGEALDPDVFLKLAHRYGLDPARVAIEIVESRTTNIHMLEKYIETQKKHGFLIALDDVGSGHSNLDRIARLKPDLIKIDRSLIVDIHREYHKQQVFRSLVGLGRRTGSVVIAEGVETMEEALRSLELGADMLQGYFFARPQRLEGGLYDRNEDLIDEVGAKFHSLVIGNLHDQRERFKRCVSRLTELRLEMGEVGPKEFDMCLEGILDRHGEVEALYILDEAGMQVTRMVCSARMAPDHPRVFCKPWERGTDHSLRNYFFRLAQGDSPDSSHVTDPYISLATGQLCVTLSTFFQDAYGHAYVLCVDMKPGEI
jgi:EAL domain-containing protein (putative c-di-GMP-specific phosphodiesterase class I)